MDTMLAARVFRPMPSECTLSSGRSARLTIDSVGPRSPNKEKNLYLLNAKLLASHHLKPSWAPSRNQGDEFKDKSFSSGYDSNMSDIESIKQFPQQRDRNGRNSKSVTPSKFRRSIIKAPHKKTTSKSKRPPSSINNYAEYLKAKIEKGLNKVRAKKRSLHLSIDSSTSTSTNPSSLKSRVAKAPATSPMNRSFYSPTPSAKAPGCNIFYPGGLKQCQQPESPSLRKTKALPEIRGARPVTSTFKRTLPWRPNEEGQFPNLAPVLMIYTDDDSSDGSDFSPMRAKRYA